MNEKEKINLIVVDFGSTSIKTLLFSYTQNSNLKLLEELPWIDYPQETITLKDGRTFSYLAHENAQRIISQTYDNVGLLKSKIESGLPIIAISSFTNNLAIKAGGKFSVLLDDPSLSCSISVSQREMLKSNYGIRRIQKASALTKLLAICKSPEIISQILDTDPKHYTLKEISLSTMLGLLTEKLSGGTCRGGIPADDVRSFGIPHLSNHQLENLLEELHIDTSLTEVIPVRYQHNKEAMFYQINDFQAEIKTIKELFQNRTLPPDAVLISLDTVAKIITHDTNLPKTIDGFGYDTIRNGGRVAKTWFSNLTSNKYRTRQYYQIINRIHSQAAKNYVSPEIYYYPQAENDENGIIVDGNGNTFTLSGISELIKINKPEDIIVAITLGLGFEIRFQCENLIDNFSRITRPIYLYGGLTSHNQTGWMTILLETMPQTKVYKLDLPSGAKAVAYAALSELKTETPPQIMFDTFLLGTGGQRNKEYKIWLSKRVSMTKNI